MKVAVGEVEIGVLAAGEGEGKTLRVAEGAVDALVDVGLSASIDE